MQRIVTDDATQPVGKSAIAACARPKGDPGSSH